MTSSFPWHPSRIKCFAFMVVGLILSRSVQQHMMATAFSNQAQRDSIVRRIQRFLKEQIFDFQAIARSILTCFLLPHKMDLIIDRTNWQFGCTKINFLVLSVTIGGQGIPLFWKALPKKGASSAQEQCDLLQVFVDTFGANRINTLMGDREFIGEKWVKFLAQNDIPFYVRFKENRLVDWGQREQKHLRYFFHHLTIGQTRFIYKELGGVSVVIAGARSKEGELVLVVSNQIHKKAPKILLSYRRRFIIETLFKNAKTSGFNFEDTHLKSPEKLEKLMAVVAVATALCVAAGKAQVTLKPTPYRSTVQASLYSVFRRGFDFLRQCLLAPLNIYLFMGPLNSSNSLKNLKGCKNVG